MSAKNVNSVYHKSFSPDFGIISNTRLRASVEAMYNSAHGINSSGYTGNASADKRYDNAKSALRQVTHALANTQLTQSEAQVVLDTMVAVNSIAKNDTSSAGNPISPQRNMTAIDRNDNLQARITEVKSDLSSRYSVQASKEAESYKPSLTATYAQSNVVPLTKLTTYDRFKQLGLSAAAAVLIGTLAAPSLAFGGFLGFGKKKEPTYAPVPVQTTSQETYNKLTDALRATYAKSEAKTNAPSTNQSSPSQQKKKSKKSPDYSAVPTNSLPRATSDNLVKALRSVTNPNSTNNVSDLATNSPALSQASIEYSGPSVVSLCSTITVVRADSPIATNTPPPKKKYYNTEIPRGATLLTVRTPKAQTNSQPSSLDARLTNSPSMTTNSAVKKYAHVDERKGAEMLLVRNAYASTNAPSTNAQPSKVVASKLLINKKTGKYNTDVALKDPNHPIIDTNYLATMGSKPSSKPLTQKEKATLLDKQMEFVLTAIAMKRFHSGAIPDQDWKVAQETAKAAEKGSKKWSGIETNLNLWYAQGVLVQNAAIAERVPDFTERKNLVGQFNQLGAFERTVHPNAVNFAKEEPLVHLGYAVRNLEGIAKSVVPGQDRIYSSSKGELFHEQNGNKSIIGAIAGQGMRKVTINKKTGKAEVHAKWHKLPVLGPGLAYVSGIFEGGINSGFGIAAGTAHAGLDVAETALQLPTYPIQAIAGKTNGVTKASRAILGLAPEIGKWGVGTVDLHMPTRPENGRAIQEVVQFALTGNGKIRDYQPDFTTRVKPIMGATDEEVKSSLILQKPASGVGAVVPERELYRLGSAGALSWLTSWLWDLDHNNGNNNPVTGDSGGRGGRDGGDGVITRR